MSMSTTNTYAKHYINRRTIPEIETYKLILFPSDNTIAVVKSKQCSPAEHDGFIYVQSGRKKFTGVPLEEGTLLECSQAADRLTKKNVNPEIESDYERNNEENLPKRHKKNPSEIVSLSIIPFNEQNSNIQSSTTSSINMSVDRSDGNLSDLLSINPSLINNDDASANPSSSFTLNKDRPTTFHMAVSKENLQKSHQRSDLKPSSKVSFDLIDNSESESNDSEPSPSAHTERRTNAHTDQLSINETPAFVGHHVTGDNDKSKKKKKSGTSTSSIEPFLSLMNKFESKYLKPLLVKQEKIETTLKCLNTNQKKIQNVLRKQKMNISIVDPDGTDGSTEDVNFLTSLEFTKADGTLVDLLKYKGVKEHANLYVTSLMDVLFKHEDLKAMGAKDMVNDDRYILLKEAVRSKFRLCPDEFDSIWDWLHDVVLAKRRTIIGKHRRAAMNIQ
ncbi:hypothetical protein I4U23_022266 [Adineta vaga]|nr:hypothetical protein I4U23_022266 [Adineta vaga]